MGEEMHAVKTRRITSNIVTVVVGSGSKAEKFQLHDFQLKQSSRVFQTALKEEWREGQEKKVKLLDDDPDIFGAYVEWLFTGKIATATDKPADELDWVDIHKELLIHARLYILGEKLLDDRFCDCALMAMAELCDIQLEDGFPSTPTGSVISAIYAGTTEASPIRDFLVDLYRRRECKSWFSPPAHEFYPQESLTDLIQSWLPETSLRPIGMKCQTGVQKWFKQK